MKALGKAGLWVAVVVAEVLLVVALVLIVRWGCSRLDEVVGGVDPKQNRSFQSLRSGMSQTEVFARTGALPLWTNREFTLGQYTGNEKEYAKTNGVGACIFYTWDNGDLF